MLRSRRYTGRMARKQWRIDRPEWILSQEKPVFSSARHPNEKSILSGLISAISFTFQHFLRCNHNSRHGLCLRKRWRIQLLESPEHSEAPSIVHSKSSVRSRSIATTLMSFKHRYDVVSVFLYKRSAVRHADLASSIPFKTRRQIWILSESSPSEVYFYLSRTIHACGHQVAGENSRSRVPQAAIHTLGFYTF
ncbi:hypothetical protein DFH11DRAFT_1241736 [Phellopilus nigrolimitatus]|nr:hypothetical protein DFH11DRAFT_1241736 [Phellopilus nigrolimitatus]